MSYSHEEVLTQWHVQWSSGLSFALMSRIERKFCLSSTSCLEGLSDIFILHVLHI